MMERVVIYSRVSTKDQDTENQMRLLRDIVERNNYELIDEYVDHGISGPKGRDMRPQFDRLIKYIIRRKFDKILLFSKILFYVRWWTIRKKSYPPF